MGLAVKQTNPEIKPIHPRQKKRKVSRHIYRLEIEKRRMHISEKVLIT